VLLTLAPLLLHLLQGLVVELLRVFVQITVRVSASTVVGLVVLIGGDPDDAGCAGLTNLE